jgi:hypothetical protein
MKHYLLLLSAVILLSCGGFDGENEDLLEGLMREHPDKFADILRNREHYEIQILYTQIDRDAHNVPSFRSYFFNFDSTRYFYPASTVKLPLVLLSLEKLKNLNIQGLNKFTTMFHDSVYRGQLSVKSDSTAENGLPSIAHYAKKILVVSDNDAYNRLYEFMGQKEVNRILHAKGYSSIRILHRLERPLTPDENRHTEAIQFKKGDLVILSQPMLVNDEPIVVTNKVLKGKGFIRNDSLINMPFDFSYKNFYPLSAQQEILKSVIFPKSVDPQRRFNISDEDRAFVLKYMSQLPTETTSPAYYSDTAYYDAYCKFLMYGNDRAQIPSRIRIFNKVGDAYGYLIDNAYVIDFDNGIEFMLSAVINTNLDEIYNDSQYDYETLGYPFMKNLGQLIYEYELKRKREHKPDLSSFRFQYDTLRTVRSSL